MLKVTNHHLYKSTFLLGCQRVHNFTIYFPAQWAVTGNNFNCCSLDSWFYLPGWKPCKPCPRPSCIRPQDASWILPPWLLEAGGRVGPSDISWLLCQEPELDRNSPARSRGKDRGVWKHCREISPKSSFLLQNSPPGNLHCASDVGWPVLEEPLCVLFIQSQSSVQFQAWLHFWKAGENFKMLRFIYEVGFCLCFLDHDFWQYKLWRV